MDCGEARLKSGVRRIGQQLPVTSVISVSSVREFPIFAFLFDLWRR
jgi:hypothetical protein